MDKAKLVRQRLLECGEKPVNYFFNAMGIDANKIDENSLSILNKSYSKLLNMLAGSEDQLVQRQVTQLRDILKEYINSPNSVEHVVIDGLLKGDSPITLSILRQIIARYKSTIILPKREPIDSSRFHHLGHGEIVKDNSVALLTSDNAPRGLLKYTTYNTMDNAVVLNSDTLWALPSKLDKLAKEPWYFFSQLHLNLKYKVQIEELKRKRSDKELKVALLGIKGQLSEKYMVASDILLTDKVSILQSNGAYEIKYHFDGQTYKEVFAKPLLHDREMDIVAFKTNTKFKTMSGNHSVYVMGVILNEL